MPQNLNTGHVIIDSQGSNFFLTVSIKSGGGFTADKVKAGQLLQINKDVEVAGDAAWAAQTDLKWGVALGEADKQGRILIVTENAGLNKKALIGLTATNAPELLKQGFKLLEEA